jgi:hypothetical protein
MQGGLAMKKARPCRAFFIRSDHFKNAQRP